ncbi:MAG: AraC family transcriptional regulator [Faecalimonas sp.]|nr:AraC family transcriptional regulator [Faecalimonas sp.]
MNLNYHMERIYLDNPLEFDEIYVSQIGRLYANSTTVIDTHMHTNLFELTIVTGGSGIISTNGIPTKVKRGDIYLSMPCDAHKLESDAKDPLKYDFFAFSPKSVLFQNDFETIMQYSYSPETRVFENPFIPQLISNAIAELNNKGLYSNELLSSVFRQTLIYIVRDFRKNASKSHSSAVTSAETLCYQLMNYIDTHIYSLKKLDELSEITDYSYGYLSTIFKKTTGLTLAQYYRERKLETARVLILENKLKLIEIAEMLNYSSAYSFSKAFKEQFGLSPQKYRKEKVQRD